jgi:hypothetical protein
VFFEKSMVVRRGYAASDQMHSHPHMGLEMIGNEPAKLVARGQ